MHQQSSSFVTKSKCGNINFIFIINFTKFYQIGGIISVSGAHGTVMELQFMVITANIR